MKITVKNSTEEEYRKACKYHSCNTSDIDFDYCMVDKKGRNCLEIVEENKCPRHARWRKINKTD